MRNISTLQKSTIIIDILILLLSAVGIYNISTKAGLPIKIQSEETNLTITNTGNLSANFKTGDIILSLDGKNIKTIEEIEIYLDGKRINDSIAVKIMRENQILESELITTRYYSTFYTVVALIVGLMFLLVGVIVYLKCDIKLTAFVLHWALVLTAMIILMTWGNYSQPNYFLGLATRMGFHFGYLFAPVFFLWFVTLFPTNSEFNTKKIFQFLFILSSLFFIVLNYSFFLYTRTQELLQMRSYIVLFDICSLFILLVALAAILIFLMRYIKSSSEIERKKIRWILLGFILGPLSYFLFWVIPSRIWNNPILPEPVVLFLVSFVPITFGIAIIKYRVLNIDIIFKRGIVYSAAISILLILYMGTLTLLSKIFNSPSSDLSSIISAVFIALLFQPVKTKVRRIVDKKFFHVEYDYRLSVNSFLTEIKDIYNSDTLIKRSLEFINEIIPISKIGFFSFNKGYFELSQHINFEKEPSVDKIYIEENKLERYSSPMGNQEHIESEARIQTLPNVFSDVGATLIYLIKSSQKPPLGILLIGRKKSDSKYTIEDIDLLALISTRLSIMLDRIKLQEEVIREHLETERLEELNKLKSYFVSSVSHDLKTPLTSIKMFAEILKSTENISPQKAKEYLDIIEGESNRLTRLIDNVLDYSKIERGIKKYNFKTVEINKVVDEILKLMEYQFKIKTFNVVKDLNPSDLFISADRDAIIEAIINIISNSIKFSVDKKSLIISTYKEKNFIVIKIADKGVGIPNGEIEKIFEPFIKSEKISFELNSGAGLGLSIVKHIMDAHKGKIKIKSKVNEGTVVFLEFPVGDIND
ncbi:MAG: ATP-binding protein [Melioribacteraceae bacterium]|nr:ATP-binding protein [Melioribacteraceae bacterium]